MLTNLCNILEAFFNLGSSKTYRRSQPIFFVKVSKNSCIYADVPFRSPAGKKRFFLHKI